MLKKLIGLTVIAISLTGCATANYQCKLGNECVDVYDVYDAANANDGNKETVTPDLDKKGKPFKKSKKNSSADNSELGIQSFEPYSGGSMTDRPVYQPPKPLRIWLAPWQAELDSETQQAPVLLSGQFMYVTIPGYWTMGGLKEDGGLGGMMMLEPYDTTKHKAAPNRIQPKQRVLD